MRRWCTTGSKAWYPARAQGRALRGSARALFHPPQVNHEVLGVPEAGARDPLVLLVVQRHALADAGVDLRRDRGVRHGEDELLRHRARHAHHGHLALPGLAEPSLARELLHVAGTLAVGVREAQRRPGEAGEA